MQFALCKNIKLSMWFGMSGPNKSLTSQSKFASLKPFVVPNIK